MNTSTTIANSRSNPYFSDWSRMGLPADHGINAFTARRLVAPAPAPVIQDYEPGKRRRLPDIDKFLPLDVQQAQRRERKKLQMAGSRKIERVARGRV